MYRTRVPINSLFFTTHTHIVNDFDVSFRFFVLTPFSSKWWDVSLQIYLLISVRKSSVVLHMYVCWLFINRLVLSKSIFFTLLTHEYNDNSDDNSYIYIYIHFLVCVTCMTSFYSISLSSSLFSCSLDVYISWVTRSS